MTHVLKRKPFLLLAGAVLLVAVALTGTQFGSPAHAHAASPAQPAEQQCSLATLNGMYVSTQSGSQVTGIPQGPFATAAIYVFDGRGHAHGITSRSVNGKISSHLTFTDTYTLNRNCTGTETVTDATGAVRHYDFYTLPSGSRFTFLRTDPGVVASGVAETSKAS